MGEMTSIKKSRGKSMDVNYICGGYARLIYVNEVRLVLLVTTELQHDA